MLRALLLAALALGGLAPSAGASGCDPAGQVCWDEWSHGSCEYLGQGWTDVTARNVMLGSPLVAQWHTRYSCTSSGRTDTWNANATAGESGVRSEWTSQPTRDWTWLRVRVTGPQTDATVHWYEDGTTCHVWTLGTVLGGPVNDRRPCPAPPPDVPVFPWGALLP